VSFSHIFRQRTHLIANGQTICRTALTSAYSRSGRKNVVRPVLASLGATFVGVELHAVSIRCWRPRSAANSQINRDRHLTQQSLLPLPTIVIGVR
jgi:hypothetical protein